MGYLTYFSKNEILKINEQVILKDEGSLVRLENVLDNLINEGALNYMIEKAWIYREIENLAAFYVHTIVRNNIFNYWNKAIALVTVLELLKRNFYTLKSNDLLDDWKMLTYNINEGIENIGSISIWLQKRITQKWREDHFYLN